MRKPYFVMLLTIFLQACSVSAFQESLFPATNTPGPTSTATITFTPTITLTATTTPTVTASPTIVHFPTLDPSLPTETFVPIPIFIGNDTATPEIPPTPVRPGPGFLSVTVSDSKIFWGNCTPNKTKITATVEDPEQVVSVVIFVQVKSMKKEDSTPWTSGDVMFNYQDGTFAATLVGSEIKGHNHYKNSWVRYQLVATDDKGEEVGRTKIYTETIDLSPCMCYYPLAPGGCPIETPKKP
jgi:hypothetical protein